MAVDTTFNMTRHITNESSNRFYLDVVAALHSHGTARDDDPGTNNRKAASSNESLPPGQIGGPSSNVGPWLAWHGLYDDAHEGIGMAFGTGESFDEDKTVRHESIDVETSHHDPLDIFAPKKKRRRHKRRR